MNQNIKKLEAEQAEAAKRLAVVRQLTLEEQHTLAETLLHKEQLRKPSWWQRAPARVGLALTVIVGASLIATSFAPTYIYDQHGNRVGYSPYPLEIPIVLLKWATPTPRPTPKPQGPTFRY